MKKKQIFSAFLSLVLLLNIVSVSVWANDLAAEYPFGSFAQEQGTEEKIRVIVQVQNAGDVARVKQSVLQMQNTEIKQEYDLVFQGFSAEIPASQLALVKTLKGVKKVTRARVYYPTMASSKLLTQALSASEKFANRGEGMVVSIIDSGIDTEHKDLQTLSDPSKAKIKTPYPKNELNKDTRFTMKVPYGYNFSDASYLVKGLESNHGIHVAGIVGANASDEDVNTHQGIDGVASEVQLLAMKVFSNDVNKKGALDDDIVAAIEASIEHQADIINMSLGSESGFVDDEDPMQKAINAATAKGVLVVIAAGNDTAAFADEPSKASTKNVFGRDDIGLVSSPATARTALSVASYENTHKFAQVLTFTDGQENKSFEFKPAQGTHEAELAQFVYVGLGREEDYTTLNVNSLDGKFALIERGKITFVEKVTRAKEKGASGVLIFNNSDTEMTGMVLTGAPSDIFVVGANRNVGLAIKTALENNPDVQVRFHKDLQQADNQLKDDMSSFTSWGSTSNLDFKPEISGIGGHVYSLDNDNQYVSENGTSMAAPHVAGISAIVYSQLKKDLPGIANYADFVKKTLLNTAKILEDGHFEPRMPFSPRRQGAGLAQAQAAIENRVLVTFEDEKGDAVGALRSFTGQKTFSVVLKNYGSKELSFQLLPSTVQTTAVDEQAYVKQVASSATLTSSTQNITLAPNQSQKVSFVLDASSVTDDFVEGYIQFKSLQEGQPDVHFSYMGYAGDWNAESIFDVLDVVGNEDQIAYGQTRLLTIFRNPLNPFDQGKIVPLGIPVSENMQDAKAEAEHIAFSPNGDGFGDVILPQVGVLRSLEKIVFNVLDSNKEVVRTIGDSNYARKQSLADVIDRTKKGLPFIIYPYEEGIWDGLLYNKTSGEMEIAQDGQYYLQVLGRLGKDYDYQELLFPLKVDTVKPSIEVVPGADGQKYRLTDAGREIVFRVNDATGIASVYGKVGKVKYEAVKQDDGSYKIVLPYNTEASENLDIFVNDFAFNEAKETVKNIMGNSLSLTSWKEVVDKKINAIMGESVIGKTKNAQTAKIALKFVQQNVAEGETPAEVTTADFRVINGNFAPNTNYVLTKQGKYQVTLIEKDAQGTVLKETSLGLMVYDYTRPKVQFNYVEEIRDPALQKNPPAKPSSTYVEYAMQLNADGTATYTGTVSDNVFSPQELTMSIGLRENKVTINEDGSFTYVLRTPSAHFDFMNISQPSSTQGEELSSTLEGLDLATSALTPKTKGLERTYTISKYLPADTSNTTGNTAVAEVPFKLTTTPQYVLGLSNLTATDNTKVTERDGKFFFTIEGFTNKAANKVFVAGAEANTNATVDGGTRFEKEIEIFEGSNAVNIRVETADGERLYDTKVRILFDKQIPNLLLEKPSANLFTTEEKVNDQGEKVEVHYVETWEDFVLFEGKISDNGLGYSLTINSDMVANNGNDTVFGSSKYGSNEKAFTKKVLVQDGDLVLVQLEDSMGNKKEIHYVVKKIEKPFEENVELVDKLVKYENGSLEAQDFVASNPNGYAVSLAEPVDLSKVGTVLAKVRIHYHDNYIVEKEVPVEVRLPLEKALPDWYLEFLVYPDRKVENPANRDWVYSTPVPEKATQTTPVTATQAKPVTAKAPAQPASTASAKQATASQTTEATLQNKEIANKEKTASLVLTDKDLLALAEDLVLVVEKQVVETLAQAKELKDKDYSVLSLALVNTKTQEKQNLPKGTHQVKLPKEEGRMVEKVYLLKADGSLVDLDFTQNLQQILLNVEDDAKLVLVYPTEKVEESAPSQSVEPSVLPSEEKVVSQEAVPAWLYLVLAGSIVLLGLVTSLFFVAKKR